MQLVILDGKTLNPGDNPWTPLEKLGKLTVYDYTKLEDITHRGLNADIIITNKTKITAKTLEQLPNLKCIGVLATGYDVVDIEAAGKKGIPVINVVEYGVAAVAQHAFALLLSLCHYIIKHDKNVRDGSWAQPNWSYWKYPITELTGKTIGILGYGHIGQRVGHLAHAFGMSVLAYNRSPKTEPSYTPFSFTSCDDLFRKSDIISLHCPLTSETSQLVNKQKISIMKDGALIVNVARGGLLDEAAVTEALISGKLGGLGTDVVSQEPIQPTNPLLSAPNVIFTPHVAWTSLHARQNIIRILAENLHAWINGKPQSVVNASLII